LIVELLADWGLAHLKSLDVLDLGCGTGSCGRVVAPLAKTLVGVDLSGKMLDQARAKCQYSELVHGEISEYLRGVRQAFDLILAADVFTYVDALDGVVALAAAALRPGGTMIFTVDATTTKGPAHLPVVDDVRITHEEPSSCSGQTPVRLHGALCRSRVRTANLRPTSGGALWAPTRAGRCRDSWCGPHAIGRHVPDARR
jgi:predicted TPR repeat methyltransferase